MHLFRKFSPVLVLVAGCNLSSADTVAIDYGLDSAVASIDPFTIPNPSGGEDITIAPSIELETGSFGAEFLNADSSGTISDGDASIIGVEFTGSIEIALSSTFEVFGFPVPVTATLTGPITAQQQTASNGTLTGLSIYAETTVGDYSVDAGPLDCVDSALGIFCTAIETALGIEFPLDGVGGTAPLPFAGGTFSELNPPIGSSPGSAANAELDFSFPLNDEISFGVEIDSSWLEENRVLVIPEPSVGILVFASLGMCLRRRRG